MLNVVVYMLSVISLYSSMNVVYSRNSINSVISLILVFIMISINLVLLNGDSLGLIIIMVYVGAVSVLFLFVIMLLGNVDNVNESVSVWNVILFVLWSNVIVVYSLNSDNVGNSILLVNNSYDWCNVCDEVSNMDVIGVGLYVLNMYNVLLSGVMLLLAIVGGLVLGNDDEFNNVNK